MTKIDHDLLEAAETGDVRALKRALERNASVNVTDDEGRTPLMRAAVAGHSEVLVLLLDAGAAIDKQDDRGGLLPTGMR